jgi:hypothetical protein
MPGGGLDKIVTVLAAADAVAHFGFFWLFAVRVISGDGLGRVTAVLWAALALVGMLSGILGRLALKYGGGGGKRAAMWAIAVSTALAGLLLFVAA